MRKNQSISLIKGIACICVVFIHCQFPGKFGEFMVALGRFAVPFFALVTGYFAYFADRNIGIIVAQKRLKDIIRLTIISSAICILFNSVTSHISGGAETLDLKTIIVFILFNRASFLSSAMWYLFALIYVYILWINALKLQKEKYLVKIAPVLLIINIFSTEVLRLPWYVSGNFLFTVFPFFAIGNYLHSKKIKATKRIVVVFLAANILLLIEYIFFGASFLYVGSAIEAISLLVIAENDGIVRNSTNKLVKGLCYLGERLSMMIYVVHCGIISIIMALIEKYNVKIWGWILPLLVLLISVLVALICVYILTFLKKRRE